MNDNNAIQEDPQTERGEPKEQSQDSQKSTIMSDDHTEQPTLASENEMEAERDEEEPKLHIQAQAIKITASIVKCSFDQLCKFHILLNTSMLLFLKNKPSIQNSETICFKITLPWSVRLKIRSRHHEDVTLSIAYCMAPAFRKP